MIFIKLKAKNENFEDFFTVSELRGEATAKLALEAMVKELKADFGDDVEYYIDDIKHV